MSSWCLGIRGFTEWCLAMDFGIEFVPAYQLPRAPLRGNARLDWEVVEPRRELQNVPAQQ